MPDSSNIVKLYPPRIMVGPKPKPEPLSARQQLKSTMRTVDTSTATMSEVATLAPSATLDEVLLALVDLLEESQTAAGRVTCQPGEQA